MPHARVGQHRVPVGLEQREQRRQVLRVVHIVARQIGYIGRLRALETVVERRAQPTVRGQARIRIPRVSQVLTYHVGRGIGRAVVDDECPPARLLLDLQGFERAWEERRLLVGGNQHRDEGRLVSIAGHVSLVSSRRPGRSGPTASHH
jgi:hypothetical protein